MRISDWSSDVCSSDLVTGLFRAAGKIAKDLGIEDDGYRVLANTGRNGHQEVPHFHLHIFGGQPLGRMIRPPQGCGIRTSRARLARSQIGRASCRERVWQDGLISGVAVYLKKQQ